MNISNKFKAIKISIIVFVFGAILMTPSFAFADYNSPNDSLYGSFTTSAPQEPVYRAQRPQIAQAPTCNGCGRIAGSDDCLRCTAPTPTYTYTQPRQRAGFINDLLDLSFGYSSVKYDNDTNVNIDDNSYWNYEVLNRDNSNRSVRSNWDYIDNSSYDGSIVINSDNDYEATYDINSDWGHYGYDGWGYYANDNWNYYYTEPNRNIVTFSNNNPPTGNLASLNSVFLSQVPYTGARDTLMVVAYAAAILVWSAIIVFFIARRKKRNKIANRIQEFKNQNREVELIS